MHKKVLCAVIFIVLFGGFSTSMCVKRYNRGSSTPRQRRDRANREQVPDNNRLYNTSESDENENELLVRRGRRSRPNRYRPIINDLAIFVFRNQEKEILDVLAEGFGLARERIFEQDHAKRSPLYDAIAANNYNHVMLLLDQGANPNHVIDNHGMHEYRTTTPLRAALASCASMEIIYALVSRGATISGEPESNENNMNGIMMVAADAGSLWCVAECLALGANPATTDPETEESLLHKLAKQEGAQSLIERVITVHGRAEDVGKKDSLGQTPLDYADLYCQRGIVSYLATVKAGKVYRDVARE